MTRIFSLALVVLAALVTGPAVAEPKALDTTIDHVTVYADRAQVTRTGGISLGGTPNHFTVSGLPGWIDPESVRASLEPASAGSILDVTVEKSFLLAPDDEKVRAADEKLISIQDQLADISDEEQVLGAEVRQLESVRAFSMEKLPQDMVARETTVDDFGKTVDFVTDRLRKVRGELRALARKRRDLQPELAQATRERNELHARSQLEQQAVTVEVKGKGKAKLVLTYLTSGASWEPLSELRVTGHGENLQLVQSAAVMQTTGEDWTGAKMTFSTQLPEEKLVVPEVQALLLGGEGTGLGEALERANQSFAKAQQAYVAQSSLANANNPSWNQQFAQQNEMQQRARQAFRQLAKRGTTAHFDALSTRAVRSDGKRVRLTIASSKLEATVKLIAVPEVSLNVVRTADVTNTSGQAILPGKARLYVDGAFVGTSELPFVAPGEAFSAFLGVHEGVKLERTIDRDRSELDKGWRRTTVKASFVITAENLGKTAVTLELGDRVPVPQDGEIEVDDVDLPRGAKKDSDGVVKWTAKIEAGKKATFRLEYDVEYPNDYLSRGRPAPAEKKRMIYDQIDALESMM